MRSLEVGQRLRLAVESMTLEGESIARVDGFVLFLSEAIPGETVEAEVTSLGADYGRARVVEVVAASEHRVEPRCRHFGACGGCLWQHLDYDEQLVWKTELLRSTLAHRLPGVGLPIRPMRPVPDPWGTRCKIHYAVAETGRGRQRRLWLGHNRAHSVELEPVRECPVHHPAGDQLARRTFARLRDHGCRAAGRHSTSPGLLGILVRTAGRSGRSQIVIIATGRDLPRLDDVVRGLLELDGVDGVHLNVQPDPSSTWLGRETIRLAGAARLVEEVAGVQFHVSPDVFFQTNAAAADVLVEVVGRAVPAAPAGAILDLYAGVGLFSLPLARAGHAVTAVEEHPRAVEDGRESLRRNGIRGCRFVADRTQNFLKRLPRDQRFATVILDPPRDGCPEWAMKILGRGLRPKRIINVSCNPQTLARDLAVLTQSGYRLREIQPIDMFPHTPHIESVTVLDRT